MKRIFRTNPEKAGNRVAINSFLIGSLFTIFTLIWTLSPEKFSVIIVTQISLAIPLLFVSSLAYSKVAYWKETRLWDTLGRYTNNLATIFIFNVVGLMIADYFVSLDFVLCASCRNCPFFFEHKIQHSSSFMVSEEF